MPVFPGLTEEQALAEINLPVDAPRSTLGVNVHDATARSGPSPCQPPDPAFWQDVLDARYHGYTERVHVVNLTVGTKLAAGGRYAVALKVNNLLQHRRSSSTSSATSSSGRSSESSR